MRNKKNGSQDDCCRYYGIPCGLITHCTIDYERCSTQPVRRADELLQNNQMAGQAEEDTQP